MSDEEILYVKGEQMTGETTSVPLGRVGGGRSERAFCAIAHRAAARRLVVPDAPAPAALYACQHLHATMCDLASGEHRCLFSDPQAPEWQAIRNTVQMRALVKADN